MISCRLILWTHEPLVVVCSHLAVTNSSGPRIGLVLRARNGDGGVKAPQEMRDRQCVRAQGH